MATTRKTPQDILDELLAPYEKQPENLPRKLKLPARSRMRAGSSRPSHRTPTRGVSPRNEDATVNRSSARFERRIGAGGKTKVGAAGTGRRKPSKGPEGMIDAVVTSYLRSIGQQLGPQPNEPEVQSLKYLRDQGILPGAGEQLPEKPGASTIARLERAGAGAAQGGRGAGLAEGGGQPLETPGTAVAGQNPVAPWLMQILNPRMSPASPQGAVPTLPGAPQGFSLYNLIRLLGMFRQLYGSLPIGGQSLPPGIGGARGLGGGY